MAAMERILTNDFSWSKSRDERFRECLRAYYLQYYASWGGWDPDAPDEVRRLYVLKKLSNRFKWAGSVVHDAIRHSLLSARFGRSIDPGRVIDRAHKLMQQDYLYSKRKSYWSEPYRRQFRGLMEHEYAEAVQREEWQDNWNNARAALAWFFESQWMPLARSLEPQQWLEIDSSVFEDASFALDGVRVFAVPDFVYVGEDGAPVVVDWKTGKRREGYADQVLGYALYISSRYGFPADRVRGSLVFLNAGAEEVVQVDAASLSAFRSRFQRSVEAMRQLTTDASANAPRPKSHFPMTEDLSLCARCVFRRVCRRETAIAQAA
jgi:hypothetical protein